MRFLVVFALALGGCHALLAPPFLAATGVIGTLSGAASIAKDVLEIDVSVGRLLAPETTP